MKIAGGNGIHGWRNHCILVGECLHLGVLIHSGESYDLLIARIRILIVSACLNFGSKDWENQD